MLIDCDTCAVRGPACRDCVVTVLLGAPPVLDRGAPDGLDLDRAERAAIAVLAGSGLVPPLRLVAADAGSGRPDTSAEGGAENAPGAARGRPRERGEARSRTAEAG